MNNATKHLYKIIGIGFGLSLAFLFKWFIVGHWGWAGYGKFSFYGYVGVRLLIALCYAMACRDVVAFILEENK
jgi:hypothetical protein